MENIYLCGFMGTGKTAVGVSLSKKLNTKYFDTDKLIVKQQNCPISDIFANHGEAYFRELETKIVAYTAQFDKAVVATGGGLATIKASVDEIKKHGKLIYLNTPFEVCYKRISGDKKRPLVVANTKEQLQQMYNTRHEIYKAACDIEIMCTGTVFQISDDIIKAINA